MKYITTELDNNVLLIGLNRPEKRNAFSSTMINELTDAYEEMEENDQVRCAKI